MDELAVRKICEFVGGLPLAIRLVGRYLNTTGETAAEYLDWLATTPLDALTQGERKLESVPLLIQRGLEQVSTDAQKVLMVAGVLAFTSFSREVVTAALPGISIRRPFNELLNYGLLLRSKNRYEVSHALIHTYARKRLHVDSAAITCLTAYYVQFIKEQQDRGLEGYARLDLERGHLMHVLRTCIEREDWKDAKRLVLVLTGEASYLKQQGYWTELVTTLQSGLTAARQLNDRRGNVLLIMKKNVKRIRRGIINLLMSSFCSVQKNCRSKALMMPSRN